MPPNISVVIPNARQYPRNLVESLRVQCHPSDEILVVNDTTWTGEEWSLDSPASKDQTRPIDLIMGTKAAEKENQADEVVICNLETCEKGGGAEARNIGWRDASNQWVLFLNDDMRVTEDFIKSIGTSIERNADADVIGIRAVDDADGPVAKLASKTVSLDRGAERNTSDGTPIALDNVRNYGVGAALLVHRDMLIETGGYKNALGPGRPNGGTDDIEFLWHVSQHSGQIVYDPEVVVYHPPLDTLDQWIGKLGDYAEAVGYLAGKVNNSAAKKWVENYQRIIEDVASHRILQSFESEERRLIRNTLGSASDRIKSQYESALTATDGPELLCQECGCSDV